MYQIICFIKISFHISLIKLCLRLHQTHLWEESDAKRCHKHQLYWQCGDQCPQWRPATVTVVPPNVVQAARDNICTVARCKISIKEDRFTRYVQNTKTI